MQPFILAALVALSALALGEQAWPDAGMLGRLRPPATRISLCEEEQRFVDLALKDLQP